MVLELGPIDLAILSSPTGTGCGKEHQVWLQSQADDSQKS